MQHHETQTTRNQGEIHPQASAWLFPAAPPRRRQWCLAGEFPAATPQMWTLARSRSASVNDASRKGLPLRLVLSSGSILPRTRPTGARPYGALHCVQRLHCLTSLRSPPSGGRRQWSLAGKFPAATPQMGTLARSRSAAVNDASRKNFSLRLVISSGSYLLSRDLASDYHRRADVSLPGSEWDRVGPSGCDHRIAGLRRGLRCCLARLLAVSWGPFVTWGSVCCVLAFSQHVALPWLLLGLRAG